MRHCPQGPGEHGGPSWAATSDLSGQLVSRVNAGAHKGLSGEWPGTPAQQGGARQPHRQRVDPEELDLGATVVQGPPPLTSPHPHPPRASRSWQRAGGPAGPSWPGGAVNAGERAGEGSSRTRRPRRAPVAAARASQEAAPRTYRLHAGPGGGQRPCGGGAEQNRGEQ